MLSNAIGMEEFVDTCVLSSSQLAAFAFHRIAYQERLVEVKLGLRVIEKLRNYKPHAQQQQQKHRTWSSGGHGVFNLSFIHPFNSNHRQRGESVSQGYDCGSDADTEDNKGKKKQGHLRDIPPDSPGLEDLKTPTSSFAFNPSHEKQDVIHEYPPSRKQVSHREERNAAVRAVRAIKSAVLHDARHIKGDDDDPSGLRFSLNSASEAKVY